MPFWVFILQMSCILNEVCDIFQAHSVYETVHKLDLNSLSIKTICQVHSMFLFHPVETAIRLLKARYELNIKFHIPAWSLNTPTFESPLYKSPPIRSPPSQPPLLFPFVNSSYRYKSYRLNTQDSSSLNDFCCEQLHCLYCLYYLLMNSAVFKFTLQNKLKILTIFLTRLLLLL